MIAAPGLRVRGIKIGPGGAAALRSVIAAGVTSAGGMIGGIILARALGPTMRGQFAALVGWVGTILMLTEVGLGLSLTYHVGREPGRAEVLFTQGVVSMSVLRVAGALVGAALLPALPALRGVGAPWIFLALSTLAYGSISSAAVSLLLGVGRIDAVNVVSITAAWLYGAGVAVLWGAGQRSIGPYVAAFFVANAVTCAVAAWRARRAGVLGWRWRWDRWRELAVFGAKSQLGSIAAQTNLRLDQVLMSVLVPPAELGYYVVAVALSSVAGPLYSGLNLVVTPRVAGARSMRDGGLLGLGAATIVSVAGGLLALTLALVAPPLLRLLFGARYSPAVDMARVLLAAGVFQGVNLILGTTLRNMGLPGAQARAEAIGAIVTVASLLFLLPRWGGMGAAVASLGAYATVSAVEVFQSMNAGGIGFRDIGKATALVLRRQLGRTTPWPQ